MKILGVGGAGCRAVVHMIKHKLPADSCLMIDMDEQWLKKQSYCDYILLGQDFPIRTFGPITPAWAQQVAMEGKCQIVDQVLESGLTLIVAGLGGEFGTGAAPVIGRICRETDSRIATITSLPFPFPFESKKRFITAQVVAKELQVISDLNIQIPYAELLSILPSPITLADAFRAADEMFRFAVGGVLAMGTVKRTELCEVYSMTHKPIS